LPEMAQNLSFLANLRTRSTPVTPTFIITLCLLKS